MASRIKKRPKYLTATEVASILKITAQGAYKLFYKLAAAEKAEVIKVSGIRINEDDFWNYVKECKLSKVFSGVGQTVG